MTTLADELDRALAAHANPERAAAQQRYMKSAMPYYGLSMPETRRVVGRVLAEHPQASADEWRASVADVWDGATHREQWYAAIALLRHRSAREWATEPANLTLIRRLIVEGAWWDVVDDLAGHCVGTVLRADPTAIAPVMREWAGDPNVWVRRAAILSQLGFGEATDAELLADCVRPSIPDKDFFARKAIGWALRQYAYTDPDWVRRYVAEHAGELSGLSKREALKHLGTG